MCLHAHNFFFFSGHRRHLQRMPRGKAQLGVQVSQRNSRMPTISPKLSREKNASSIFKVADAVCPTYLRYESAGENSIISSRDSSWRGRRALPEFSFSGNCRYTYIGIEGGRRWTTTLNLIFWLLLSSALCKFNLYCRKKNLFPPGYIDCLMHWPLPLEAPRGLGIDFFCFAGDFFPGKNN